MEELKKINLTWEKFIVSANMQLDASSTPQSRVQIPFPASSVSQAKKRKKIKRKHISQDKGIPKEVEEEEMEVHHSPQREISPQPAPKLHPKGEKIVFSFTYYNN